MKKNNKIIFGMVALTAVAVGTVGFASWLVGVQKTTQDLIVKAEVDNIQQDSVFLTAKVTNTPLIIAEKVEHIKADNELLGASGDKVNANALKFSFETLKFEVGETATMPTTLNIALKTEGNDINKVNDTANNFGRDGADFTYLALNTTVTLNDEAYVNGAPEAVNGIKTFELKNKDFEFGWGTYFNAKSPVEFYNEYSKAQSDLTSEQVFDLSNKAFAEVSKMTSTLAGELTIVVSLGFAA